MKNWPATLLACLLLSPLQAQFQLNGNAVQLNDSCYRLTDDVDFVAGSIWNLDQIDLSNSFDVVMEIYLGCQDDTGADGIVFGFQPISTSVGTAGQGIGFGGISPSIGFEFDTWQNNDFGDPTFDHLALVRDGNMNHNSTSTLAGPTPISATDNNVEDCDFHELAVSWDAQNFVLKAYFDCALRLEYTGDIVNEIFNGDPLVFWGFTAATGSANNIQQICFSYTTFLDQLEDVVLCPNGSVQLQATTGLPNYSWTPTAGLSNPNIYNPIASPTETTTYIVEIQDDCGRSLFDSLTVFVDGDSSFVDLGPDTSFCTDMPFWLNGYTPNATYLWNTGAVDSIIQVYNSGYYSVTVTVDDYCYDTDQVSLTAVLPPEILLPDDPVLCIGTPFTADVSIPGIVAEYEWSDGTKGPVLLTNQEGTYSVSVTNFCGITSGSFSILTEDCQQ
ncbi:MAG: hypothetical protein KDC44_10715, partial [Phaeodactylibacter sp.]|nr:hypothetical protein [Phaeodactylibacter sp.]